MFLCNGDGTFQAPIGYSMGSPSSAVIAADLNGDGKVDLAVASYGNKNVSVLLETEWELPSCCELSCGP